MKSSHQSPANEPRRPIPSVIAVVIKDDAVLLVQRANAPDAGLWGFPGGRIEFGELVEQAALRELLEETGVRAKSGPTFAAVDAFDRTAQGELREHYVLFVVLCEWISGEPMAGDDALAAAWHPLDSLDHSALPMSQSVPEVGMQAAALVRAERLKFCRGLTMS